MRRILIVMSLVAGAAHAGGLNLSGGLSAAEAYMDTKNGVNRPASSYSSNYGADEQGATQYGVTASFTGRMEQVQTVSGLYAWRCEYDLNGQRFTRLYQSGCPGFIRVQ